MTQNAFLAVAPTDDERHAIAASLADASPGPRIPGRRVPPTNWHITLRFLGPIDELLADVVSNEVERALDAPPGRVTLRRLGAFPRASRATVVHVEVDDPTNLLALVAAQCEAACREAGLEPEERPFVPHLTLARVRPAQDVRRLFETFGDFAVPVAVRAVTLLRTERDADGLRYRPMRAFPLE